MGLLNLFKNNKTATITQDGNKYFDVSNKKEAEFYANGMLKIVHDCANIINTTKNPSVFFERYNLLINTTKNPSVFFERYNLLILKLENLAKLECFNLFNGTLPSQNLEDILNKKENTINDFIDRYYQHTLDKINSLKTTKAKDKKVEDFYKELSKYNDNMLSNNIQKYTSMYKVLLNK